MPVRPASDTCKAVKRNDKNCVKSFDSEKSVPRMPTALGSRSMVRIVNESVAELNSHFQRGRLLVTKGL